MFLLRWFIKITSMIPALIALLPRVIYLGRSFSRAASYKGPLIAVMNHRGFRDYPTAMCIFPWRKPNAAIGAAMYEFSPFIKLLLKAFGGIKIGSPAFFKKSTEVLNKGGLMIIYPEGKIETTDELLPFKTGAALLSLSTGAPVLPMFHDGKGGLFRRDTFLVGDLIYPEGFSKAGRDVSQNAEELTAAIYAEVEKYHGIYNKYYKDKKRKRKKHDTFAYRFLLYTALPLLALFRPRLFFESAEARAALVGGKRTVIISNHGWWLDAPLLYKLFLSHAPRAISAPEFANQHSMLKRLQKGIGCIFIDRTGLDWGSIKTCMKELNRDGSLIIFPEGHMNYDLDIAELHDGAAMLSLLTGADIVPVYIASGYKVFRRTHIMIGTPITRDELSGGGAVTKDIIVAANDILYKKLTNLKDKVIMNMNTRDKEAILNGRAEKKAKMQKRA